MITVLKVCVTICRHLIYAIFRRAVQSPALSSVLLFVTYILVYNPYGEYTCFSIQSVPRVYRVAKTHRIMMSIMVMSWMRILMRIMMRKMMRRMMGRILMMSIM